MRICTEVKPKLSEEAAEAALEETHDNAPEILAPYLGNYPDLVRFGGVILTGKKWEPGRILTCKFLSNVDPRVAARIRDTAEKWSQFVNLELQWATSMGQPADIRISTVQGDGSWSYLGTDAKLITDQYTPTMNYGWLEPRTDQQEYDRVVLHEFGHAFGFPHEHQHPEHDIPWDRNAVIRFYSGPPNNWTMQDIDHNIFTRYSETITKFSAFDRDSIMLYPIPNELTIGDYAVGWNLQLSAGDKRFARWQYPFAEDPPGPGESKPLEDLPRVAISRFERRYDEELVVTRKGIEVAHSRPLI